MIAQADIRDFQNVVDDYAKYILILDEASGKYDLVLDSVEAYLQEMTPEALDEASDTLMEAMADIQETADAPEASDAPEAADTPEAADMESEMQQGGEIEESLEACGILYEEYAMFADGIPSDLDSYIQNLAMIGEWLADEEEYGTADAELERRIAFEREIQEITRRYYYVTVNYWFAGCSREQYEYLEKSVFDRFVSFRAEEYEWADSREEVEEQMGLCLDEYAKMSEKLEKEIADSTEELYEMKEKVREKLKNVLE